MKDLKKQIEDFRPTLKQNSINAYLIIMKKLNGNKDYQDLDFLKNKKDIDLILNKLKLTTRRNYITAMLVVLQAVEYDDENLINYYRNKINKLNEEYTAKMSTNTKSEKQEANWLNLSELDKIREDYGQKVKKLDLKNKIKIKPSEFSLLQEYLVSALYTLLPPIRLDYSPMLVVKSEKDMKDGNNYLINSGRNKKKFIINEYKNVKSKGQQIINIPSKLNTILNMYLKYNDTGHLLLNNRKQSLSSNGLGKLITSVFKATGKQITINLLRSMYISQNIDMEAINAAKTLADAMGHSTATQQKIYFKKETE